LNQRFYFFKRRLQLLLPYYFAHHVLCENYSKEVFNIRSWYICRGCTLVYGSTLVTFVISVLFNLFKSYSLFEILSLVLIVSCPTWFGFVFSFEKRLVKDLLRISLGTGWGIALSELWLEPMWSNKIIIFFLMVIFLFVFQRIRRFQTSRRLIELCDNCKDFNVNTCRGYKSHFEAERLYSKELSDFLQKTLTWSDIQTKLEHN
jgi:hypothetical protein